MDEAKILPYLKALYPSEDKRVRFIYHSALTFALSLETLERILATDKGTIYKTLHDFSDNTWPIEYLFNHRFEDQSIAYQKFANFFKRLIIASSQKDQVKMQEILGEIYDAKAREIKRTRQSYDSISDDDIKALAEYQIKYALTLEDMAQGFNISLHNYHGRVKKLIESYPDLKRGYTDLVIYNESSHGHKGVRPYHE